MTDRDELIALGLTGESKRMSDGYTSFVIRTDEEAADLVLNSEWLRVKLRDVWDAGVAKAGRYGHEDYWDDELNPYNENPYRTDDEKEEY